MHLVMKTVLLFVGIGLTQATSASTLHAAADPCLLEYWSCLDEGTDISICKQNLRYCRLNWVRSGEVSEPMIDGRRR